MIETGIRNWNYKYKIAKYPLFIGSIRANKLGVFIASAKKVYSFNKPISLKFAAVHRCGGEHCEVGISPKSLAAQGFASHTSVLAAQGKAVRYHGDEFTICGLALARLRLADGAVP